MEMHVCVIYAQLEILLACIQNYVEHNGMCSACHKQRDILKNPTVETTRSARSLQLLANERSTHLVKESWTVSLNIGYITAKRRFSVSLNRRVGVM